MGTTLSSDYNHTTTNNEEPLNNVGEKQPPMSVSADRGGVDGVVLDMIDEEVENGTNNIPAVTVDDTTATTTTNKDEPHDQEVTNVERATTATHPRRRSTMSPAEIPPWSSEQGRIDTNSSSLVKAGGNDGNNETSTPNSYVSSVTNMDLHRMKNSVFFLYPDRNQRLSRFWILLTLAATIATSGVVSDSAATVIGASTCNIVSVQNGGFVVVVVVGVVIDI
jgi:hypothetical protein